MIMRPWAGARAQGRKGFAALLFFMQVSLVFWPAAVRAAQRLEMERQKQELLNELAAVHAMVLPIGQFHQHEDRLERVS
jgi:hypothetical protein